MKSKTYQKEGWLVLEVDNSVFGHGADNTNKNDFEEKFSIYHNKDEAKKKVDISSDDLTSFIDSLVKDVPELSDEEVNSGVEKILARAYPAEETVKPSNNGKVKRITLRALFVAALLIIVSLSCLCVMGTSHNISVKNGFVTFAKDTVKVVFFGDEKEELIDVKSLLEDLESHGFENVLLPQKLYDYKSSVPVYSKGVDSTDEKSTVVFSLYNEDCSYSLRLSKMDSNEFVSDYFEKFSDAKNLLVNDLNIRAFQYENDVSAINYVDENYSYFVQSDISLSEMINTAQTIIKTEE